MYHNPLAPTLVNDNPVKIQLHLNTILHNIHPKLRNGHKRPSLYRAEILIPESQFHANSMEDIDQKFHKR